MSAPNISLLGATYSGVKGVTLPKSGGGSATFPWVEGSETKTVNGTYDVTNLSEVVVNVSGSAPNIQPLSITQNGTYTASGGVDGYSPITVSVSGGGGASNIVTGEFTTGSTENTVESFTIPYTGSGYPIECFITPKGGFASNSRWNTAVKRYTSGIVHICKNDKTVAPDYGGALTTNGATFTAVLKNSTSSATTYNATSSASASSYTTTAVTPTSSSAATVKFLSNTKINYCIGNGTTNYRGLLSSCTYTYIIVYSS